MSKARLLIFTLAAVILLTLNVSSASNAADTGPKQPDAERISCIYENAVDDMVNDLKASGTSNDDIGRAVFKYMWETGKKFTYVIESGDFYIDATQYPAGMTHIEIDRQIILYELSEAEREALGITGLAEYYSCL